jgi:4-hydroxy-4-methyl-2-oxoglutarate aldolase
MRFPVWSAAVSAQGTVKQTPGAVNVAIAINGQLIGPGDVIVADDDGVVRVAAGQAGPALAAARARAAKEEQARQQLAAGVLGLDLYGLRDRFDA